MNEIASEGKMWFQSEGETDAYDFPITPKKTPEKWEKLISLQEMIDACQIPESELEKMSTEGLLETCLSYPLFGNMMLHDSPYRGFLLQIDRFNGLHELLERENAGSVICDLYYNSSLKEVIKADAYPTYRFRYLEYIISQPEILKQLSPEQKQELLDYALGLAKIKAEKYSDTFSIIPTALIIGRIMAEEEQYSESLKGHEHIKRFIESGMDFTDETWEEMLQLLQQTGLGGFAK